MTSSAGGADATGGSDEAPAPLTDKEIELVKRLFSDPFAIPLEFKAWLVAYLETNPPLQTASSIFGFHSAVQQQIAAAAQAPPVGAIMQYFADVDPPDQPKWLLMNNRLLSRAAFPLLFGRIGFTGSYPTPGVDPGGGQFYLPEGRGAVLVGKGTPAAVAAVGNNEGLAATLRNIVHKHLHGREVVGLTPGATNYSILGNQATKDTYTEDNTVNPVNAPSYTVVNHIIYAPG